MLGKNWSQRVPTLLKQSWNDKTALERACVYVCAYWQTLLLLNEPPNWSRLDHPLTTTLPLLNLRLLLYWSGCYLKHAPSEFSKLFLVGTWGIDRHKIAKTIERFKLFINNACCSVHKKTFSRLDDVCRRAS